MEGSGGHGGLGSLGVVGVGSTVTGVAGPGAAQWACAEEPQDDQEMEGDSWTFLAWLFD